MWLRPRMHLPQLSPDTDLHSCDCKPQPNYWRQKSILFFFRFWNKIKSQGRRCGRCNFFLFDFFQKQFDCFFLGFWPENQFFPIFSTNSDFFLDFWLKKRSKRGQNRRKRFKRNLDLQQTAQIPKWCRNDAKMIPKGPKMTPDRPKNGPKSPILWAYFRQFWPVFRLPKAEDA